MGRPILDNGMASSQDVYAVSTTPQCSIGVGARIGEQRFRYASCVVDGGVTAGNLCAAAATVANHVSVVWASGGAAGSDTITLTLAATAATANQYAEGYLIGIDGTGSNQMRRIKSHPAAALSATLQLTLYDPIETAAAASSEWSLMLNPYTNVRIHPGSASILAVGVNPFGIPDAVVAGVTTTQYIWLQVQGPCLVQGDGTTFVSGLSVQPTVGTTDAGQITIQVATGDNLQNVGRIIDTQDTASDLDFRYVWLDLD